MLCQYMAFAQIYDLYPEFFRKLIQPQHARDLRGIIETAVCLANERGTPRDFSMPVTALTASMPG